MSAGKQGKPVGVRQKCPPHYWDIDEKDYGRCRYCLAERDFGAMLCRISAYPGLRRGPSKGGRKKHYLIEDEEE